MQATCTRWPAPRFYIMTKDNKKQNPYTGDLFGVEECQFCKGKGTYTEPDKDFPGVEYIEDCEHCDGTGVI